MRAFPLLLAIGGVTWATMALAHGPTPKKVDESIQIKADPKAVWAIVGDFAGIAKWNPELSASTGDSKKRVMTFKNGEKLEEEADDIDQTKMSYDYRMLNPNVKALPVSSYSATLAVTPKDGGSEVEWYGRFYRGDTGNEPPDDLNDEAGQKAMTEFFRAGLEGLKAKVEGKS